MSPNLLGAGLCVEQGWGLSAAAEILPREEGGLWIPPYSLVPIFSGVLTVPGVVKYTTWFVLTTQCTFFPSFSWGGRDGFIGAQ